MTLNYDYMQNKYETTKPIRGRAEDIRPIGKRRRDWEQIVKRSVVDGEATYTAYAARLYNTDVVTYYHDGTIGLRCDNWATPSTAEFMWSWTGLKVYKRNNQLWLHTSRDGTYLIPREGELKIRKNDDYTITVINPVPIKQKVVDRKAIKTVRDRVKPFTDFCTTILKMSDGLITKETMAEFAFAYEDHWWDRVYQYKANGVVVNREFFRKHDAKDIISFIENLDSSEYMPMMLAMLPQFGGDVRRSNAKEMQAPSKHDPTLLNYIRLYDYEYPVTAMRTVVDNIIKKLESVHKLKDVEVGKCVSNVVV